MNTTELIEHLKFCTKNNRLGSANRMVDIGPLERSEISLIIMGLELLNRREQRLMAAREDHVDG